MDDGKMDEQIENGENERVDKEETLDDLFGKVRLYVKRKTDRKAELETRKRNLQKEIDGIQKQIEDIERDLQRATNANEALEKVDGKPPRNSKVETHCLEVAISMSGGYCIHIKDSDFVAEMGKRYPTIGVPSIRSSLRRLGNKGLIERVGPKGPNNRFVVLVDENGNRISGDGAEADLSEEEIEVKKRVVKKMLDVYPSGVVKRDLVWEGQDLAVTNSVLDRMLEDGELRVGEQDLYYITEEYLSKIRPY